MRLFVSSLLLALAVGALPFVASAQEADAGGVADVTAPPADAGPAPDGTAIADVQAPPADVGLVPSDAAVPPADATGTTGGAYGCEAKEGKGCPDCPCEAEVCAADTFCCDTQWDDLCAKACAETKGGCGVCPTQCTDKQCGDDGCGGTCGMCKVGEACTKAFKCEVCTPSCTGKICGDDGCGGKCGAGCASGETCSADGKSCGKPIDPTLACTITGVEGCCDGGTVLFCENGQAGNIDCAKNAKACGWNPEAKYYDCVAPPGASDPDGNWPIACGPCEPKCDGKSCGDDGCGGECGVCKSGEICGKAFKCEVCTPACDGKICGPDGCGGACGKGCGAAEACAADGKSCVPKADPKDACNVTDAVGCCSGNTLLFCENNKPGGGDCPAGKTCTWIADKSWYDCGDGPQAADPSGTAPLQCGGGTVGPCEPKCTGKQCGPDGCGGKCGDCPTGSSCNTATGKCLGGGGGTDSGGSGGTDGGGGGTGGGEDGGGSTTEPKADALIGGTGDTKASGADTSTGGSKSSGGSSGCSSTGTSSSSWALLALLAVAFAALRRMRVA